jgi:hypothetical protein
MYQVSSFNIYTDIFLIKYRPCRVAVADFYDYHRGQFVKNGGTMPFYDGYGGAIWRFFGFPPLITLVAPTLAIECV